MKTAAPARRNPLRLISLGIIAVAGNLSFSACTIAMQESKEPAPQNQQEAEMMVFVGTYTTRGSVRSEGIYVYRMDPASGALKLDSVAKGVVNPSYLEIGPKQRYLFAVNEVGEFAGKPGGGVSAFSIDPKTARLTPLNQQPAHGAASCYVSIEQTGRFALVANYSKGNVIMLPILADGKLGPAGDIVQHHGASIDQGRQEAPRAHCIIPGPDNRYAFAADLGIDKIIIYRMDLEHGKLLPHGEAKAKPGAGPRHFTFHPNGRYAYLIQELNSTLTAFAYDAEKGSLEELQTLSTLPEDFKGRNHCADVHVSPSGKFVYGSNRGHDSIAMFAIDEKSGTLTSLGHEPTGGRTPRNFAIDPTGTYLLAANQDTSNIVTFRIDPQTGKLKKTDHATNVPFPVCVKIINFRKAQAGPSR